MANLPDNTMQQQRFSTRQLTNQVGEHLGERVTVSG